MRRVALATATVAAVGLMGVRVAGPSTVYETVASLLSLDSGDDDSVATTTILRSDLLEYDNVCTWIEETEGVDDCTSVKDERLNYLVPSKIEIKLREDLVEGSIGSGASKGYFVYNMVYNEDDDACSASWFIVMSLKGVIKTIVPLKIDGEVGRAAGVKFFNDNYVLFAGAKQMKFGGNAYKMDWRTGDYEELCDASVDIHDVQRSSTTDAIWFPKGSKYERANFESGEITFSADVPGGVEDLNHVQLIDDDTYAIFSSRLTNTIIKAEAKTATEVWYLGGDSGEFTLTDLDGYTYAAGHSYWKGQHNAEYIGDGEYALFDNNYDHETAGSRLIVVSVDEDSMAAAITFEYNTGTYTKVGGDNDLVPSGNMFATWWQSETYSSDELYDSCIAEIVTSDSSTALEVKFYSGRSCDSDDCSIDDESWYAYSVERFYETPTVYGVSCTEGSTLPFSTFDTHKAASATSGTYKIYDASGSLLVKDTFDFVPHWRITDVEIDSSDIPSSGSIIVLNQYGTSTTETFSC